MNKLSDVRINQTGVELTEENIQPGPHAAEFDLPFIVARCTVCDANLSLLDGVVTCLNACWLPSKVAARRALN